jgi:hypothetical protein
MRNYVCKKCRTKSQGISTPPPGSCTTGSHVWIDVGKKYEGIDSGEGPSVHAVIDGNLRMIMKGPNYECSKCKETLMSSSVPETKGCPQGQHNWLKIEKTVKMVGIGIRG